MRRFRFTAQAFVLAVFFGSLGCSGIVDPSPPVRFYLLAPLEPPAPAADGPGLGVGPIRIAKYLDRPQIVTRTGSHALALGDFDRWGEPLAESISRVLAANLGALLGTDRVQRHPWRDKRGIDVQVVLDLHRFDGPLGGPVELEVHWQLRRGGAVALQRVARIREPFEGSGYAAQAAAMSRALHALSKQIAAAIGAG